MFSDLFADCPNRQKNRAQIGRSGEEVSNGYASEEN
jgi:hypothetical protein